VVPKKPVKKPVNKAVANDSEDRYSSSSHCYNCGVVESVRSIEQQEPTSGVGAGVGAVVGGLVGNQVGSGNGRTLATIAGAVGGGLVGNTIEKRRHTHTVYEVTVRMNNGDRRSFTMGEQRWRAGDRVRVEGNSLIAQ
jgi:outer membrane lipoprotein SlyB